MIDKHSNFKIQFCDAYAHSNMVITNIHLKRIVTSILLHRGRVATKTRRATWPVCHPLPL